MVFSYGKKIRRLAAQVLSADPDEMRALRQRLLPPRGDEGAPVLRIKSEADRTAAPAAILSAVLADEITAEEADDLMQRAERPQGRTQAQQDRPYWIDPPPELSHLSPEELRQAGYLWRPELDPLADAIRAWGEPVHCGAARERAALVNINENTSASAGGDAAGHGGEKQNPL
jgi:hypothetical protein